jgi:hypothetical protein
VFEIVLIIAAVCFVMFRRVTGEPAQAKRMLLLPAVLMAMGFSDVSGAEHNPAAMMFLIGTAAVSIVMGALRGLSTRLSEQDGIAYVHYTGVTILLWLLSLAAKFGLNFLFQAADPHAAAAAGNSLPSTGRWAPPAGSSGPRARTGARTPPPGSWTICRAAGQTAEPGTRPTGCCPKPVADSTSDMRP